ncbi:enoyl-CoA hydratase/isomerase family protein [Streptomyces liangshanensis]|uniref:Enoyl-CoA hydratase/isomerase family protein n=1 Tax=Streptomyces liangshanensis TaxID=2717324 RepID=A0A6G9GUW2_9ACTN|nr:enoyl-CoA hydratase/isomerase family protein [Streptomyces liangshanensis]QIQ01990.1 enoyl-CoA hydratase/isomerase family protein [Streptomyces liangshanensis]
MSDFKTLRLLHEGAVLGVELNSPETGNAVSGLMLDELLAVLGTLADRPDVRVLVLSGAGDHFCLGADRAEFAKIIANDPADGRLRALGTKARMVCDALATSDVATVARVHGGVIGAGVALAVFCDLRVGAEDCRFRLPELALGMPPAWGGSLPRLIQEAGAARVRELLMTGENFTAARAADLSLLHKVVPVAELDDAVDRWTRPLVRRSAAALRTTKIMMNAYASAARLADASLFDAELMTVAVASRAGRR